MPDINENAETQQEYFGKAKLETDYKDLSMRLYKRIADLEKENAELKSGCGMCYRKDKEQLTKAKEIIRECIKHTCDTFCEVSTCEHCLFKLKVKDKAEQFLKDSEGDK